MAFFLLLLLLLFGLHPAGASRVACAGNEFSCAVSATNASTSCVGRVGASALPPAIELTCGQSHACAVLQNGTGTCWGTCISGACSPPPATVQQACAGMYYTLWLDSHGYLWGSGSNLYGVLGDGPDVGSFAPTPRIVQPPQQFTAPISKIACNQIHACFLSAAGELACQGFNDVGQIPNAFNLGYVLEPILVEGVWTDVACGAWHTCAIAKNTSTTWCVGLSDFHQVVNGVPASKVFANGLYTVVLDENGVAWFFGSNGQMQNGQAARKKGVFPPSKLPHFPLTGVAAGVSHLLVWNAHTGIWGAGSDSYGELGAPPPFRPTSKFVRATQWTE